MLDKARCIVQFLFLFLWGSLDSSGHTFFDQFKKNSIPNFFGKNTTTGKFCVQNSFVASTFARKTCLTPLQMNNLYSSAKIIEKFNTRGGIFETGTVGPGTNLDAYIIDLESIANANVEGYSKLLGGLLSDAENANKGALFQLRVAKSGGTSGLTFIEYLDNGRRMDLSWAALNKECKFWTDPNAKALFRTDIEKELPLDIASGKNFEWVAPKQYWTETQFQDMVIDLYKADKLEKVKDALDPNRTKTATQIETFFRTHFKVCCP